MLAFKDIERSVVRGETQPAPDYNHPLEMFAFVAIRGMYQSYSVGTISKAQARQLKSQLIKLYEQACQLWGLYNCALIEYQYNIQLAGHERTEILKSQNEKDALGHALKIISALLGEKETEKTTLDNIEKKGITT